MKILKSVISILKNHIKRYSLSKNQLKNNLSLILYTIVCFSLYYINKNLKIKMDMWINNNEAHFIHLKSSI